MNNNYTERPDAHIVLDTHKDIFKGMGKLQNYQSKVRKNETVQLFSNLFGVCNITQRKKYLKK